MKKKPLYLYTRDPLHGFVIAGFTVWFVILPIVIAACLALAGCESIPATGADINPPSRYLMAEPREFPVTKPGDDARIKLAEAAEVHNKERRRIKALQRYINIIRE